MGDRFIEGAEDLSVSDVGSTDNDTINDVIGNKEDIAQIPSNTTSIVSILKKIYDVVITIAGGSDPEQVTYIDITSAANSIPDTTILTADGNVILESVIVQADSAQTTDMTSIGVYGGINKVLTLIDNKDGKHVNFDATNKQVAWTGVLYLPHDGKLVMDHVGTGGAALDLTVSIIYRGKLQ